MSKDLITVCIPTRNRPEFLRQAVESCIHQTYRPLEIIVGDDSDEHDSADALSGLRIPPRVILRRHANRPPLGQAENINLLLELATGPRVILLHDDDWLLPGAVEAMAAAWDNCADTAAVFGRQLVSTSQAEILPEETERLNRQYNRTQETAGVQASAAISALQQQFPNDGYLIDSDLARQVRCRPPEVVGRDPDLDFGVRYGLAAGSRPFVLLDQDTAVYRLSADGISRSGRVPEQRDRLWEAFLEVRPPPEAKDAYEKLLDRLAPSVLLSYAQKGQRLAAWRIFCSARYKEQRLGLHGIYHAAAILSPIVIQLREALRSKQTSR